MRTLLGMQYGGNVPQQYPRQQIPPQQFQEGGVPDTVSAGLAGLRRLGKKREARDVFGEEQTEQIGKQKSGSFLGSVLGLGSGATAAWLVPILLSNPATAAAALPWLVGGATGAGKWLGEYLGYGGKQDIDTDIAYGKEAGLEDIERAGDEYRGDMWKKSLLAGAKAGLTAGYAPSGGIYGKIAGRGAPAIDTAVTRASEQAIFDSWSPEMKEAYIGWVGEPGRVSNRLTSDWLASPEFSSSSFQGGSMINQQPQSLLSYLTR